jgi:hypothetical protein
MWGRQRGSAATEIQCKRCRKGSDGLRYHRVCIRVFAGEKIGNNRGRCTLSSTEDGVKDMESVCEELPFEATESIQKDLKV